MDIVEILEKSHLKEIRNYEPGKPTEELERELGIRHAIKMASNENAMGPSPRALTALRRNLTHIHRYPDAGSFYLKRSLAKHLKINSNRLILGNGSDELIVLAIRAYLNPGEEVVIADPTFLVYRMAALVQGGRVIQVPMKDFRYDLRTMAEKINANTRIVFIANPDNPVGTYVKHGELLDFIKRVPGHCLIFIDEAYYEYALRNPGYAKSIDFLEYTNVMITRTFSKAYGLAGLRVGYGFGAAPVISALEKVREPFNINRLAQAGAEAALGDKTFLKRVTRTNDTEKKKLEREFDRLGLFYVKSATNFILVRFGPKASRIYSALLSKGIIVRNMAVWGLAEYLRITIGKPSENRLFIKALRSVTETA